MSAKPRRSECRFPASERPFDTRCIERRQLGELGDLAVGRDRGADCRGDHIGNRAPEVTRIGGDVTTRKGKLRPALRRTSETVVRTHVVVITAHADGGQVASTRPEESRNSLRRQRRGPQSRQPADPQPRRPCIWGCYWSARIQRSPPGDSPRLSAAVAVPPQGNRPLVALPLGRTSGSGAHNSGASARGTTMSPSA